MNNIKLNNTDAADRAVDLVEVWYSQWRQTEDLEKVLCDMAQRDERIAFFRGLLALYDAINAPASRRILAIRAFLSEVEGVEV